MPRARNSEGIWWKKERCLTKNKGGALKRPEFTWNWEWGILLLQQGMKKQ